MGRQLYIWRAAIRPGTLVASIVPVLVGLALAYRAGSFNVVVAAATMAAALLIQIGTNLANDYYDFVAGADREGRLGPLRVTQAGLVKRRAVKMAAYAVLGLAALTGLYLVKVGGWPILVIGVLSLLSALAYSTGPWPLAYQGMGDIFVFVFFGLVAVNGTLFLQTGELTLLSLAASVPVACLVTAILVVNNLRDIATDREAGKRTLAVRLGSRAARIEYSALVGASFLALPILGWLGGVTALLGLASLPFALWETRALYSRSGAALNLSLAGTAQLHLLYGLLLSIGLTL